MSHLMDAFVWAVHYLARLPKSELKFRSEELIFHIPTFLQTILGPKL